MPSTYTITNRSQMFGAAYAVTLPVFQGPLDLLLQLIEKQEMDISEISLVTVTDQYLQTIGQMQEIEPGALADFLVVASRLLYIKSRRLLPQPRPPEEESEEDSTDALIKQLLEYRLFKQVAERLRAREDLGLRAYTRTAPRPLVQKHLDPSNGDPAKLHAMLRKLLQRIPNDPPMPRVKTYPLTIAEQIEQVRSYLRAKVADPDATAGAAISFTELLGHSWTRIKLIVTFLAVLELIKQHEIQIIQDDVFGEIVLVLMAE